MESAPIRGLIAQFVQWLGIYDVCGPSGSVQQRRCGPCTLPILGYRMSSEERPMNNSGRGRPERKLAAILAADGAGYSRPMGADEAGTAQALLEHQLLAPIGQPWRTNRQDHRRSHAARLLCRCASTKWLRLEGTAEPGGHICKSFARQSALEDCHGAQGHKRY